MTVTPQETVLIIGAGIIGIACAHFLSKAGYKVTVIDKGMIAGGCSHGNCGHIMPSHILPLNSPAAFKTGVGSLFNSNAPFKIRPQFNASFLNWLLQFSFRCFGHHQFHAVKTLRQLLSSSREIYDTLIQDIALNCEWNPSGLLYLFKSDRSLKTFSKTNAWLSSEYNIKARELTVEDLATEHSSLSQNLAGGFFYDQDASLRPDLFAHQWAEYLKAQNVVFIEHCEFKFLEKNNTVISKIQTSCGEFVADHVVIAAGAMTANFSKALNCAIPVQPGKGYSVTFDHSAPHLAFNPSVPIVLPEKSLAITPFQDRMRIGSMMEFVGFDNHIPTRRILQLREDAQPYFRATLGGSELERWFGWRPMTWDSLPIIGRTPHLDNAYLATGHNMIGMMSAPATGKLIAEIISQEKPHINCEAYTPHRFN